MDYSSVVRLLQNVRWSFDYESKTNSKLTQNYTI